MVAVLSNISNIIIPVIIFYIVAYGLAMRSNVYEDFIKGAKDGFHTVIQIMPTLIGLMVAVGVLRASGFLDFIGGLFSGIAARLGFSSELVPLMLIKMFSSSAATGLVLDIFKNHGPDSLIGLTTSIMMSLYGDDFLYDVGLFPGGESDEDKIYAERSASCHVCGNCRKHCSGRYDGVGKCEKGEKDLLRQRTPSKKIYS